MKYLKRYIHPQWGSVLGSEKEIRLAVLRDEVMRWHYRVTNDPDDIPNLEYIKDMLLNNMLLSRIEELENVD